MAIIYGTNWNDDLYGDAFGYAENDLIYGYDGDDDLFGLYGNDSLYGGSGADWLYGGFGNDYLNGGSGDDVLYGEAGHDRLSGETGYDDLYGGSGNDTLSGGSGDDWLSGGTGRDSLTGGAGSDTFFFSTGTSGIASSTADVITDWNSIYDWIDMTVAGTSTNYREASTNALSIAEAAYAAESVYTSPSIVHVFLFNPDTDTGYLISDLNRDGRFETGVVMRNAGYASALSSFDIV